MDGMTVSMLSPDHLITAFLLIVNELCHRFRVPLSSHHLCHYEPRLIWKILQCHPFPNVDLVVQSVTGVIYPMDVQSLIIQGIVAIHIGIGVMENSMDE